MPDFRCSAASIADHEALAGTAPTQTRWLFVEQPGAWEPKVALMRPDARVQLVRRPGGGGRDAGAVVFWADLTGPVPDVRRGVLDDASLAATLDPATLTPYDAPLLLVCTHGRRDLCCAAQGRPVAAALAERWPEETWETTHLGGHRFAATLLALPSGLVLGRLDPTTALAACEALLAGRMPAPEVVRGRAGLSAPAQVAEAAARDADDDIDQVRAIEIDGEQVTVSTPAGSVCVRVVVRPGTPRRQSCAGDKLTSAPTHAAFVERS